MVNLADIAREAGQGGGLDAMSRQLGLDPASTARAVEALLPAFTLAFQRLVQNPVAFAEFTKAVTSGVYASFFDNPGRADAVRSGMAIVEQLFRSPEATKQVAAQAAALTGIGVQAMQQAMPILAATIIGGMFRYATVEGFAELLRQWGDALKMASEQLDPPKPQDPWSAWQRAAGQMIGLRSEPLPPPPKKTISLPDPANVLDAWVSLVGAMTGLPAPAPARAPAAPAPRRTPVFTPEAPRAPRPDFARRDDAAPAPQYAEGSGDPSQEERPAPQQNAGEEPNPFEAMSQMFETGREMQAQHVAAFQSILDNVWGAGRKN
ncbi:DUF937 domain-containing protein [Enterovirga sp.]|uniref:DUF937 domain-containing protein n=1 Tax=Enterovirga sp. TaxID=2026350 RepID=UPI002C872875|nr:DUF937 domain-containing protein [Enterovirga sp.]HMO29164.1 DUF937 domain-containing protein [Enterovirga sp.]